MAVLVTLTLTQTLGADLQPGDPAPDFKLKGSDGKTYALSDFKGRQAVVLAWFPKAFTPGCTKECISMATYGSQLKSLDAAYFTASCDDVDTNTRFAESVNADYPILSDPDMSVARQYGVVTDERKVPYRWTFYIGKDGNIVEIDKEVNTETHGLDVANRLRAIGVPSNTPDNTLSSTEKAEGWKLLFDGETLKGWRGNGNGPLKGHVVDGTINPFESGHYVVITEEQFEDFIFKCDVKMGEPDCNSGIFYRVSKPLDPVQNGFEVQVFGRPGNGVHDFGAIYDLAPTTMGTFKYDDWHTMEVKCEGPLMQVRINGKKVCEINTDDFDEKGKRPDGSDHKFGVIKDMARKGHIGFQDHGHPVWYKNVKILKL